MIVQRSSPTPFIAPSEQKKSLDKVLKIGPGGAGGSNTTQLNQIHESPHLAPLAEHFEIDLSLINPAYDQYKIALYDKMASEPAYLRQVHPPEDESERKQNIENKRNVLEATLRIEMLHIDGPGYDCDAIERRGNRIIYEATRNEPANSSKKGILTEVVHRAHVDLIPDVLSSLDNGIKNGDAQPRDKDAVVAYAARWIRQSGDGDGKQQLITLYATLKYAQGKKVRPEILAEVVARCGNGLHFYPVTKTDEWMLKEIKRFIGTDPAANRVILNYQTVEA
jgi:hypothetical protein